MIPKLWLIEFYSVLDNFSKFFLVLFALFRRFLTIPHIISDFQAKSGNVIFANSASLYVEDPKSKGFYGGIFRQKGIFPLKY